MDYDRLNSIGSKFLTDLDLDIVFSILGAMKDGIMIVDSELRIQYYNKAMERIEGLSAVEVLGKRLTDVFPFQTYEKNSIMQAIREGKQVSDYVQSYVTYEGKQVTVVNSTIPIVNDGRIIGAFEITKDISSVQSLMDKVMELQEKLYKSQKRNETIKIDQGECYYHFEDIVGESKSIKEAIGLAKKTARTTSTVLISGETGTGKEVFAQSIHNASKRKRKPFVAVNCAALPSELLEGILFGTTKGGFTGSINRPGLFEQASGGTLYLDEIDSMALMLQAKLLRVLQEGYVRRVGATQLSKIDVRLISSTNSNLDEAMKNGRFRQDLFYRLSVVNIRIPALRNRKEDIKLISHYFIGKFNEVFQRNIEGLSFEVAEMFDRYYWPGNVRELEHCIEASMNFLQNEKNIDTSVIPLKIKDYFKSKDAFEEREANRDKFLRTPEMSKSSLEDITQSIEKEAIKKALIDSKGNVSKAAVELGIKRQVLQYKMKKFGLRKENLILMWRE